jgi:hypothetical protein
MGEISFNCVVAAALRSTLSIKFPLPMDSAAASTNPRSLNCIFFRNDAKYEIINHATMEDHTQEEEPAKGRRISTKQTSDERSSHKHETTRNEAPPPAPPLIEHILERLLEMNE